MSVMVVISLFSIPTVVQTVYSNRWKGISSRKAEFRAMNSASIVDRAVSVYNLLDQTVGQSPIMIKKHVLLRKQVGSCGYSYDQRSAKLEST